MRNPLSIALPLLVIAFATASAVIPNPLPKAPEPVEDILRLQIFLDTHLFGPGKLDGRPGEFTTKALKRYQRAHGLPETEMETHTLDLSSVPQTYTTYTIRPEDLTFVGELPSKPAEQSKKKSPAYDCLLEFLTERFHCAPDFLEFINQPLKLNDLKPGEQLKVPSVQPFLIEELTQVASLPEIPEHQARVIKIDTREKMLDLWEGEKLLASLPITPGSGHLATHPRHMAHPRHLADAHLSLGQKCAQRYGVRSGSFYELPIGPNNPVGVMWIGLNKPGIGIHGTNLPQSIGRSSSHGCMRTANWDVVRLVKMTTKGMRPVIIEGPAPDPRPVVIAKAKK